MTTWIDAPTEPGYWLVWQPADKWPCSGKVHCVLVERERHGKTPALRAWVPCMDFDEPVEVGGDERASDTWEGAKWTGPVTAPEAPAS